MLAKRSLLSMVLFALTVAAPTVADDTPGVTATEIKIGNTNAYSGPASAWSQFKFTRTRSCPVMTGQKGPFSVVSGANVDCLIVSPSRTNFPC